MCKEIKYDTRECQVADWKSHRVLCEARTQNIHPLFLPWLARRDQQMVDAPQAGTHAETDIWLTTACTTNNWTTVTQLLTYDADPNERRTISFWRPRHSAAFHGAAECADLLIMYGADVNLVNDEGETPLMIAAATGDLAIVQSLLRAVGVDLELISDEGKTALNIAHAEGHDTIVQIIEAAATEKVAKKSAIASKKQAKKQKKKKKERKLQQKELTLASLTAEGNATGMHDPVVTEHPVQVQMASSSREVMNLPPASQELLDKLDEMHLRAIRAGREPNTSDALSIACWQGDAHIISLLLGRGQT
jgi:hypothetical protein